MNWWVVGLGLVVHLVFFYSIFDIYFTSPLVHGMTPRQIPLPPPAKRLVLFVADGLRADKLFELGEQGQTRAPFIRKVLSEHGAWGVSHTRVPTESRPGHVAVIAGFYEDVSAVAKGWKENPVEFDSLFNESRYTWSWGSPDILPMFAKGATGDHVFTHTYPAESEDFAGRDLAKLDTWVFDNVKDLLVEADRNETLWRRLHEDQVVLFLHLLGLDTNGHAHRPYSEEYLKNIGVVDAGTEELMQMIEAFYQNDGSTAYVLTSDHGMTNWGSHGAGHPSETLTPLVAWGAGIRRPRAPRPGDTHFDGFQEKWMLTNITRRDVNQADICPLMAALIGTPYPLNSVGVLPLDYLDVSDLYRAESIFTNARQLVAQFEVKMALKKDTTLSVLFTPYKPLLPSKLSATLSHIRKLVRDENYQEAIVQSHQLIKLALEGLNYYHNYDRFFLGTSVTLGFTGWMSYLAILMLQGHTNIVRPHPSITFICVPYIRSEKGIRLTFTVIGGLVTLLLYVQSLPWAHYVYCLIPVILWHSVVQKYDTVLAVWHYIVDHGYVTRAAIVLGLGVAGLEIIVLSFHVRELLSIGLVAMAVWPLTTSLRESYKESDQMAAYGWLAGCLLLAVFPLLPVVGRESNYAHVIVAGCLLFVIGLTCVLRPESRIFLSSKSDADLLQVRILTIVQLSLVCLSVYIVRSTAMSLSLRAGLPAFNQIASWVILGSSFLLPVLSSTKLYTRLLNIGLAFIPPYLLLSTAYPTSKS